MSSRPRTLPDAFPNARCCLPHSACPRMGSFRRSWVVPELTEDNWRGSGVVYRDAEGQVVYATICEYVLRHEPGWQIERHVEADGRLRSTSLDCFSRLESALEALSEEVAASIRAHGTIPEDEWPKDAESAWIVFSVPRRTAS